MIGGSCDSVKVLISKEVLDLSSDMTKPMATLYMFRIILVKITY